MKQEFIVERNGRSFVLYAGLLDLAHERGLKAITTTLVQIPSDLNSGVAIVHAIVETEQGTFTGLGDAAPDNVSRMMLPHLIRMAETRAKARALRDAVNVGATAFEELGELADDHQPGDVGELPTTHGRRVVDEDRGERAPTPLRPTQQRQAAAQEGGAPATPKQLEAINNLARKLRTSVSTEGLDRHAASALLSSLIDRANAQTARGGDARAN